MSTMGDEHRLRETPNSQWWFLDREGGRYRGPYSTRNVARDAMWHHDRNRQTEWRVSYIRFRGSRKYSLYFELWRGEWST